MNSLRILAATVRYLWRPTLKGWRALRAQLMGRLPKPEKDSDVENGK